MLKETYSYKLIMVNLKTKIILIISKYYILIFFIRFTNIKYQQIDQYGKNSSNERLTSTIYSQHNQINTKTTKLNGQCMSILGINEDIGESDI